jgi:hypothetical protein
MKIIESKKQVLLSLLLSSLICLPSLVAYSSEVMDNNNQKVKTEKASVNVDKLKEGVYKTTLGLNFIVKGGKITEFMVKDFTLSRKTNTNDSIEFNANHKIFSGSKESAAMKYLDGIHDKYSYIKMYKATEEKTNAEYWIISYK